ncbi:MAG TPA: hypothetical protein VFY89_03680 [Ktedonobacterales bacterium]
MRSTNPPDDHIERARDDYYTQRDACAALEAELAAVDGPPPAPGAESIPARRVRRLRERVAQARRARDAAHTVLGRALLEQFAGDISALAGCSQRLRRSGDTAALQAAAEVEESFRRACLSVLARWPELAEEAQRRLRAPAAEDGRILH